MDASSVRIDKWLWAVRLFRTRTLAAEACRSGHVTIADQKVKPSREVRVDEEIVARTGEIVRTVRVIALLHHRVGAPKVSEYAEDRTPASEYLKGREHKLAEPMVYRPKGAGRPTKKDRRALEKFFITPPSPEES
jgi:ribosome-associated heat shock protein Hsp15